MLRATRSRWLLLFVLVVGALGIAVMARLRAPFGSTVAENPITSGPPQSSAATPEPAGASVGAREEVGASRPSPLPAAQPRSALEADLREFATQYSSLAALAANGDAAAARRLYEGLSPCRDAPRTEAEVINRAKLVALQDSPAPDAQVSAERLLRQRLARCSVLGVDARVAFRHWLDVAARSGDPKARLDFVELGAPSRSDTNYFEELAEYRDIATRYLDEELKRRNADALRAYAAAYARGVLFGHDPQAEYAYLYAFTLSGATEPYLFQWLARARGNVPADQWSEANARGEEIYRSCCG